MVLGGKGPCGRDSGGPIVQYPSSEIPGKAVQLGIITYGHGCPTRHNSPQINTRVKYFIPWIKEVVPVSELKFQSLL